MFVGQMDTKINFIVNRSLILIENELHSILHNHLLCVLKHSCQTESESKQAKEVRCALLSNAMFKIDSMIQLKVGDAERNQQDFHCQAFFPTMKQKCCEHAHS